MARDFATMVQSGRGPSDRRVGSGQERPPRQRVEESYVEPLGPADLIRPRSTARSSTRKTAQFATKTPRRLTFRIPAEFFTAALSKLTSLLQALRSESPLRRPNFSLRTLACLVVVALIGTGAIFVWRSNGVSTTTSPAAEQTGSSFANRVSMQNPAPQALAVSQREPSSATATASLQVSQQLEAVARDLVSLQRSVQQLTATQDQNTQSIATLQALAGGEPMTEGVATLQAIIEKQKQMAEEIATLQAVNENLRQKASSVHLTQAAPPTRPKKPAMVAAKQFAESEEPPAPVRLPFLDPSL
jgi:hypothetical protein